MARQIITTANAPASPLYSQGVKAGPQVFVSGAAGIDPSTGSLVESTIQAQTRQALTNCEAILHGTSAGGRGRGPRGLEQVIACRHPPVPVHSHQLGTAVAPPARLASVVG